MSFVPPTGGRPAQEPQETAGRSGHAGGASLPRAL